MVDVSEVPPTGGITVVGEGKASATPTLVMLVITTEITAATASHSLSETGARMTNIQQAMMSRGISHTDMHAMWINAYPIYPAVGQSPPVGLGQPPSSQLQYGGIPQATAAGASQGQPQTGGFFASRGLRVTVQNVHQVGDILDTAIATGATFCGILSLEVDDDRNTRRMALEAAQCDAHSKAQLLATMMERQLGAVTNVIEDWQFANLPVSNFPAYGGHVSGAGQGLGSVLPSATSSGVLGTVTYASRVKATYELR